MAKLTNADLQALLETANKEKAVLADKLEANTAELADKVLTAKVASLETEKTTLTEKVASLETEKTTLSEKVTSKETEITKLKSSITDLNEVLKSAEEAPVSSTGVKVGNKNYDILVPQFYYEGKLIKTATDLEGNKELQKFALASGILADPKAEEGEIE